jgi:outer membrane protein assembly factor BamB
VKPDIKWRYKVKNSDSDAAFTSGPVLGADGTIYATFTGNVADAGVGSELVAIKSGKLVFEAPLPAYGFGTPAIGSDGTIYVTSSAGVSAVTPAGVVKWTYPMAIGNLVETSSPAVLPNGTVVVAGAELVALHPDGTKAWSLPSAWDSFTPSLAVTPISGMLVVSERSNHDLAGTISLVSTDGKRGPSVSLDRGSDYTPLVSAGGLIVGASSKGVIAFDETGAVKHKVVDTGPNPRQPFMTESAPFVWFGGAGAGDTLLGFDLEQGRIERTGLGSGDATVAAGDGSLVSVRSSFQDVVVGMDRQGAARWTVELDQKAEWIWQPALDRDGSVIVTDGPTVYVIADPN